MPYRDKILRCIECQSEFVFTAGEQTFYAEKGFKNEPRRCKTCKARRSEFAPPARRAVSQSSRSVTATTCSQCGKETTVPFKLTQGRPVYCLQCYQQRRAASASA